MSIFEGGTPKCLVLVFHFKGGWRVILVEASHWSALGSLITL